jgi:outer membrane protein
MTSVQTIRAFAAAACVTLCTARGSAAQSGVMAAPQSPMSGSADSTISYPQLTLDQVIARTMAVSPTVAAGVGNVQTARSGERVANGAYLPAIVASSAASRTHATSATNASGAGASVVGGVMSNETFGLAAAVDVFTGGRRRANEASARAVLTAAGSALVSARYSVRLLAQQGFYEVVRAAQLADVARAAMVQAEQLSRYTTDMSRAGIVTRSDLLRAQLQLTTSRQQLLAATDTLRTASYALGRLVGADGPVGAKNDSISDGIRPLALEDSSIIRIASDVSPGVTLAQALAAADAATLRAARSFYVPTISAGAGYDWARNSATTSGGVRPGWTVSVVTSYPLFNGFQREDLVTRARVAADVAQVTVSDARRSARAGAAQLLGALSTTTATMALGVEAVRSAREDLRVQTARYRAGISTILDVLTSQSALVQAEFSLAQSQQRYHITRAALEALIGRNL